MATLYSQLLEQVVAKLNSISHIGLVHDRERWAADQNKFINLFIKKKDRRKQIRGWTVSRVATSAETHVFAQVQRDYAFLIRGYYGFKDERASERGFQDMIEEVMNQFDDEKDFGGLAILYGIGPAQLQLRASRPQRQWSSS